MVLYVDETESEDYFIVAGLLTESKKKTDLAYKHFKKKLKTMKLSPKDKEKVFVEFKAVILDRHYQKIKLKMLNEIKQLDHRILFSVYVKKEKVFNQVMKEQEYMKLLDKIVTIIDTEIDIIFDTFNKADFEEKIVNYIGNHSHVCSIVSKDSRAEAGLQFIDNLCSIIRLSKYDKQNRFYQIIQDELVEIV